LSRHPPEKSTSGLETRNSKLQTGPLSALHHRDFALLWGGLVTSSVGSQFSQVAMSWQIYELTNSALQIGLLGLARGLPGMVVVLFGGLLADAVDRRRLLFVTQVGQLVVAFGLVVATVADVLSPGVLYGATLLLSVMTSLENPARQALVPNLVPRTDLTNALALNSTQRNVAMIAGPSLAGLLLGTAGPGWCYGIEGASRFAMLGALALMRAHPQSAAGRQAISLQSLREGFVFTWTHPIILSLMALDFVQGFLGNPRALLPIFAKDILGVGPQGLGLLYAASSVGAIGTAAAMSVLPQIRRAGLWVMIGVGLFAAATVFFAISHVFWFSLLMLSLEGVGNTFSVVLRGTISQLATPDELRGRVSSINQILTMGGPQLGQFRAGAVGELMGAEMSALVGGLATLAVVGVVAVAAPAVRKFEIRAVAVPVPA
jgi:MFS family permease